MLGHTARLLYDAPGARSNYWVERTQYFALLESFAAHARSLMDFFYPTRGAKKRDILATHYIPGWTPPEKWESFDQDRRRVGTEILHLSFDRPTAKIGWQYGELVEGINYMLDPFITDVDEARVRTDFKDRARSAMANPMAGWVSGPTHTSHSMTRLVERH